MADDDIELDMDATLSAAFDEAESREDSPQNDMADLLTDDAIPEDTPAPVEAASDEELSDQGADEAADPDVSQSVSAPARWSAEDKAAFDALPPDAKGLVMEHEKRRDAAFTQKTQEIAEQRKTFESVEQILAPRRQTYAVNGVSDDAGYLSQLFALSDMATTDPAGFVKWFAEQRGLSLGDIGSGQPTQQSDESEWLDPENEKLHQRLQGLEAQLQQNAMSQQQAATAAAQAELDQFIGEKTEAGEPARPHYETVKGQMATLLRSGAAKDLAHAYDMAVWSFGETRELMLEQRNREAEAARIAETKKAAADAKKARGVQPRTSQQPSTKAPRSLDDMTKTMEEVYDRMEGA